MKGLRTIVVVAVLATTTLGLTAVDAVPGAPSSSHPVVGQIPAPGGTGTPAYRFGCASPGLGERHRGEQLAGLRQPQLQSPGLRYVALGCC